MGTDWDQLIIEDRSASPRLNDDRFQDWMSSQSIFISSTMDEEMMPARNAVRDYLYSKGAEPVMWEEITPTDQHARQAYLSGVDRSKLFALMLGRRYGVRDEDGYSPTHREERRAANRGIPRLLFEDSRCSRSDRDGPLNDWIDSLHNDISAGKYANPDDLKNKLDRRLRETAAAQELPWVKLGPLVFPGVVESRGERGAATYTIKARLRSPQLRAAIHAIIQQPHALRIDRLTWALESVPIDRVDAQIRTGTNSEDDVVLKCHAAMNRYGPRFGLTTIHTSGGQVITPSEQVQLWAHQALFDPATPIEIQDIMVRAMTEPEGPVLPAVLSSIGAHGWLAEGLTRLYIVEHLLEGFGGEFETLEIGPATAVGVRVDGRFTAGNFTSKSAILLGNVPLKS